MSSGNKEEALEQLNTVTRIVSLVDNGLFERFSYYSGDEEIAVELYDDKGVLIRQSGTIPDGKVKEYYANGVVRRIMHFKGGQTHGKRIDYYPSGEILEESGFRHGKLHGPSKIYRRDGTLWINEVYYNGILHGALTSYHDNGSPETKAQYTDGNLNGSYIKYDRYGCLQERGVFNAGKKEGDYILYHENGQPARIERHVDGKLICWEELDEDGNTIITTKREEHDGRR